LKSKPLLTIVPWASFPEDKVFAAPGKVAVVDSMLRVDVAVFPLYWMTSPVIEKDC
jgi:hypothetical protein